MELDKRTYETSQLILDLFSEKRLKKAEKKKLDVEREKLQKGAEEEKSYYKKWENFDKEQELEAKQEAFDQKSFSQADFIQKTIGCNKDHQKEIDIYSKSYEEKMARIKALKEQGNEFFKKQDFPKASYYYAQAILIFYYLIPENDKEEEESSLLKKQCHLNQARSFFKQNRYKEGKNEAQ